MEEIESIREEFVFSEDLIIKTDFGNGAGDRDFVSYPVKIKNLARISLTSGRHARRLSRAARFLNAGNILEIGTSLGITTAYLALSHPYANVITLEGCPELSRTARTVFDRLGIENVELMEGRFEDTLEKALQKISSPDLVFIDGNHRKEAMISYFNLCRPLMKNNSLMVFDDIHLDPETEEAWNIIRHDSSVSISLDLFYSGWLIFRQESSREHFRLRYI